ncbi:MAG: pseudouridine-5-phosphate glycosidase [Spirochaetae bacterium HGW-Spirochaetae-3]|jgi:pseudouridine-5'-phosphate glycosidase|nr:MAG: pseudouridine-5-phosphate glycosidase [Spirochaetae bacterium HGW-Spirochaetae-3]
MNEYLDLSEEVRDAIGRGAPVVALESTIISHGMPYPRNAETAIAVEARVRESGAVPATIAIIGGRLKAGLSEAEIRFLGERGHAVAKVSRRDVGRVVAAKADGATTVAATMIVAEMAGIRVFATGGIGGVHRGAELTMDVSADLDELGRTSVAVVCAGAKSILDIAKTLEYLETKGVPVVVYRGDEFPAFYTSKSGIKAELRMDSAAEIASMIKAKWSLGLSGGVVVANPIPVEYEMQTAVIDAAIEKALKEAAAAGVRGKDVTPFMLAKVKDLTGGDSLESNIALVMNNASLASALAVEYSRL